LHILVSNDDGINAEGLREVAKALAPFGRITIVAPDREKSGCSHSLTMNRPLRADEIREGVYAVDGTPADCINMAVNGLIKDDRPDMVVSGINLGANLGDDVTYSGTVAAAREGAILGIPSFSISLDARSEPLLDAASQAAVRVTRFLLGQRLPRGVFLNVNVPNLPPGEVRGYRWTYQGRRSYGGPLVERKDPRDKTYYWIGGIEHELVKIDGSDIQAVLDRYVSLTPLQLDLTHYRTLEELEGTEV